MRWPEKETRRRSSRRACGSRRCGSSRSYWATDYDWRKVEARLQALPQFITEIDGVDIHFIHVRSKHDGALPVDRHARVAGLDHRAAEDHRAADRPRRRTAASAADAFDVVIPSLPGHGFSGKPTTTGWDPIRIARAWVVLMERLGYDAVRGAGRRLGQRRHRADGAAAADGAARHPHEHAGHDPRRHREGAPVRRPAAARPLGRGAVRVGSARLLLQARPRLRAARWRTVRRRCTRSRIRPSAWPRGCSITTRASLSLIARVFDGAARGADARRHPRQRHALLADEDGRSRRRACTGRASSRSSPRRASTCRPASARSPTRSTRRRGAGRRAPIPT